VSKGVRAEGRVASWYHYEAYAWQGGVPNMHRLEAMGRRWRFPSEAAFRVSDHEYHIMEAYFGASTWVGPIMEAGVFCGMGFYGYRLARRRDACQSGAHGDLLRPRRPWP